MFRNLTTRYRKHRARVLQEAAWQTYLTDIYQDEKRRHPQVFP